MIDNDTKKTRLPIEKLFRRKVLNVWATIDFFPQNESYYPGVAGKKYYCFSANMLKGGQKNYWTIEH